MVTKAQQAKIDAAAALEAEQQNEQNLQADAAEGKAAAEQQPQSEPDEGSLDPESEQDSDAPVAEVPLQDRLAYGRADLEALTAELEAAEDSDSYNLLKAEHAYLTAYLEVLAKRVQRTQN